MENVQNKSLDIVPIASWRPCVGYEKGRPSKGAARYNQNAQFIAVFLAFHGLDPSRQPGNPAGDSIAVRHALGDAAHHFGLGRREGRLGVGLVTLGDRVLDPAHVSPDAADPRAVDDGAALNLANAFLRRSITGHS